MSKQRPSDADRAKALNILLHGLSNGDDPHDVVALLAPLHPKNNTFPGEVLMELGADALAIAAPDAENPIRHEGLLSAHLPELDFGRREAGRFRTAVLYSASLSAGLEPDLFEDVAWWTTDDYWRHAALAAIALVRASAEYLGVTVAQLADQLAAKHGVALT